MPVLAPAIINEPKAPFEDVEPISSPESKANHDLADVAAEFSPQNDIFQEKDSMSEFVKLERECKAATDPVSVIELPLPTPTEKVEASSGDIRTTNETFTEQNEIVALAGQLEA